MPAKAKKSELKFKPKRLARQPQLPGVQDNRVASLENAALNYAEIRDQRQELTKQESDLKQSLLKLMHKLHRTEYKRDGISITVEVEQETVKVRVRAQKDMPEGEEPPNENESPDGEQEEEQEEEEQEQPSSASEESPF